MPTYEMLWDCGSCGTKKLLGKTHRRCPNCGAAQNAKKRYFPAAGEEVAVENHVFVGVDWACAACQTPNSRAAAFCVNCGHPREGNADVALVGEGLATDAPPGEVTAPSEGEESGPRPPAFHFAAESAEPEAPAPEAPGWLRRNLGRIIIGVVVSVLAFFFVAVLWKEKVEVAVERHTWVREIDIERMAARATTEWCDSMPGDAYGVSRSREQRSTRQIADGQECHDARRDNGDGTFSTSRECSTKYRSEPVYDDRCRFTINRWGLERTARNTGAGLNPEPSWPLAPAGGGTCMGCERPGARRETLEVALRGRADRNKTWKCVIDNQRWRMLGDGELREIEVRVLTGGAVCDTLQP